MAAGRKKPACRLITELTITGTSAMHRAFAASHVVAKRRHGPTASANNTTAFLRTRLAEYLRRLKLAGIPVEVQTRAPKSQLPPPTPPKPGPIVRDHRMTDVAFSAELSKGLRTLRGRAPITAIPALRIRAVRDGYELVRVERSRPEAPALDAVEAREAHGGLDDATYVGCDGTWHLFERRKGVA